MNRLLVAAGIALYIFAFSLFLWFYFELKLLSGGTGSAFFWILFLVPAATGLAGLVAFTVGLRT